MTRQTRTSERSLQQFSLFSDYDIHLFREGNHFKLFEKLGSHVVNVEGQAGTYFAVWAPNAAQVSVIGDFNNWAADAHLLHERKDESGIWEGFLPDVSDGAQYKYRLRSRHKNYTVDKADPFAFYAETPPRTASIVRNLHYDWNDDDWIASRRESNALDSPWSIYEVHLGSWQRVPDDGNRHLTYRELAQQLTEYVRDMGFTHVEFMPITEHPFYGSWGYQTTGYFAPTSRYGTPEDFMYLVDRLHDNGIGAILDWVPSHFPNDEHGLTYFDGTSLFEHADPRKGFHPEWTSYIFNYGRNEVKSFLVSSAMFWLDKYHLDGLRVDAVASMLYLDYARKPGEWIPNEHGGNENLEAIAFLKTANEHAYKNHPDIQTIAEESTAWPMVSRPAYLGGLGFGMKWNMGWMHDTLNYFSKEPVHRKFHHDQLTFSIWYSFNENFLLPLSHDEVVYGKGALIGKMPGNNWEKFANLRLLFGYMYGHPGKKLLFMGGEFGQWREWNHDQSLDWHLLEHASHQGLQRWLKDLNHFYRTEPALYQQDFEAAGFEWADLHDWEQSIIAFIRKGRTPEDEILVVCNMTPLPRSNYRIGVPRAGFWREALNSDAQIYGGAGRGNLGGVESAPIPSHGRYHSLSLMFPPLGVIFLKRENQR